jgi:uncharacterized membrane protein
MIDMKFWYQSRTVWGALIAIAASVAHMAGITIDAQSQAGLVDSLITLSGAFGGLLATYGRIRADKRLG